MFIPKRLEESVFDGGGFAANFLPSLALCSRTNPLTPGEKIYADSLANSRFFKLFRYTILFSFWCVVSISIAKNKFINSGRLLSVLPCFHLKKLVQVSFSLQALVFVKSRAEFMNLFLAIGIAGSVFAECSQPVVQDTITNPLRTDGFGGQFQTIIYSVIYAELNNLQYVYTPFSTLEHNYNDDPLFVQKKESLINFLDNFSVNQTPELQQLMDVRSFIDFFEKNLINCMNSQALRKIKYFFRLNKSKEHYFDCSRFNIAIHIRRLNPHDSRVEGTDIPDKTYLSIFDFLKREYESKRPIFHIYSQGNAELFEKIYGDKDVVLHINEELEDTFSSLVFADVLATSTSSLSYTAGILSDGIVYYIPFWHPPMPHWICWDG